jgi:hypothetical protein
MSFIQAIEGLSVPSVPASAPQMMVGTLWLRTGKESQVLSRIRILDPHSKVAHVVENNPASLSVPRSRTVTVIGGFPLNSAGVYSLVVESKKDGTWVQEASIPFEVSVVTPAELSAIVEKRAAAATTSI